MMDLHVVKGVFFCARHQIWPQKQGLVSDRVNFVFSEMSGTSVLDVSVWI